MAVVIKEAISSEEILACWGPIFELNDDKSMRQDEFVDTVRALKRGDKSYTLLYIEGDAPPSTIDSVSSTTPSHTPAAAIIDYRIQNFLRSGKTMIIESMCTEPAYRARGYASLLLVAVKERAKQAGCIEICLDSTYDRHDAHRLYLNKGFILKSHHFDMDLDL